LVEDQFRGHAGIRTTEDDCERLLSRDQRGAAGMIQKSRGRRLIRPESPVAVAKASQSFDRSDHDGRQASCCPPNGFRSNQRPRMSRTARTIRTPLIDLTYEAQRVVRHKPYPFNIFQSERPSLYRMSAMRHPIFVR